MTVEELVNELRKFSPTLQVMCNDSEHGGFPIKSVRYANTFEVLCYADHAPVAFKEAIVFIDIE